MSQASDTHSPAEAPAEGESGVPELLVGRKRQKYTALLTSKSYIANARAGFHGHEAFAAVVLIVNPDGSKAAKINDDTVRARRPQKRMALAANSNLQLVGDSIFHCECDILFRRWLKDQFRICFFILRESAAKRLKELILRLSYDCDASEFHHPALVIRG
jgi:hypothetical protein